MTPSSSAVRAALTTVALAVLLGGTSAAVAQSDQAIDQARQAYLDGTRAADDERWADAVRAFRQAYRLSRNPAALFNVGTALRALGRYVEARDSFRQVSRIPEIGAELRTQAEELIEEVGARVAGLELVGASDCVVTLDGVEIESPDADNVVVEVDPGRHTIVANCEERFQWSGDIADGGSERVRIPAPSPAGADEGTAISQPVLPPPERSHSGFGSGPMVLTVTGALVAATGAVLWIVAAMETAEVEDAAVGTPFSEVEGSYDRGRLFSWLGPTMLGVGLAGIGAALLWAGASSGQTEVAIGPRGVSVHGVF